jgi:hypothetical protein
MPSLWAQAEIPIPDLMSLPRKYIGQGDNPKPSEPSAAATNQRITTQGAAPKEHIAYAHAQGHLQVRPIGMIKSAFLMTLTWQGKPSTWSHYYMSIVLFVVVLASLFWLAQ